MRISVEELASQVRRAAAGGDLVKLVFSGRTKQAKPAAPRVDIRPVLIGGVLRLQHVRTIDGKHVTDSADISDAGALVDELLSSGYGNVTVTTTTRVTEYRIAKAGDVFVASTERASEQDFAHDRRKQRLLDPADPLLVATGVSTASGQVKSQWADKYRQVEDFLRIASTTLDKAISAGQITEPTAQSPLRVVDLGCGHAYLTFALQAWLERVQGWPALITGVDVKVDSMQRNRDLAAQLGITNMDFVASPIAEFSTQQPADVMLALHACDTATDDALAWSVRNQVSVLLSVPCCHHDIQAQMTQGTPRPYAVVTKHGILSERLGDVITDAIRAGILREHGYRVDVIEFVSAEHTPRNVMIRAVHTGSSATDDDRSQVQELLAAWNLKPALMERLLDE